MKCLKNKKLNRGWFTTSKIVVLFIILQPSFFLLAIREQFRTVGMGNTYGTVFFGMILGALLFILIKKLNIVINIRSWIGVKFLGTPFALFTLTRVSSTFNNSLFWLIFIFIYVVSAAMHYIKCNAAESNRNEVNIPTLAITYLILALMVSFISMNVLYSPDSYSYYEMSQTLFSNFGLVNTIRQYQHFTELGISFPYFLPMLIRFVNAFTGFSIYSGNIINLITTFMCIYFLMKMSRRLTSSTYPGIIAIFLMIFNPEFMEELMSARAVPLSILCVLLILDIVIHSETFGIIQEERKVLKPLSNKVLSVVNKKCIEKELFFMGLFAGMGMVIRFDFIVISGLTGVILVIYFCYRKNFLRTIPFYILGLLIFTMPWIVYSIFHFHTPWISDNKGTITLIYPSNPLRFFHPDEIVPTIFTDRVAWLISRLEIFQARLGDLIFLLTRPITIIVTLGITALSICSVREDKIDNKKSLNVRILWLCIIVVYIVKSAVIYLVGYSDLRYHAESIIIVLFFLLCTIYRKGNWEGYKRAIWPSFVLIILFVSIMSSFQSVANNLRPRLNEPFVDLSKIMPSESTQKLESLLIEHGQFYSERDIRLLKIYGLNVFEFGAHTDILTFASIVGKNEVRLLYLVDNFIQPNYIYVEGEFDKWVEVLSRYYLISRVGDSYAFALTPLGYFCDQERIQASNQIDADWNNGVNRNAQALLFENTPENNRLLNDAIGFRTDAISVGIVLIYKTSEWIYVFTEYTVKLNDLSYPKEITILRY